VRGKLLPLRSQCGRCMVPCQSRGRRRRLATPVSESRLPPSPPAMASPISRQNSPPVGGHSFANRYDDGQKSPPVGGHSFANRTKSPT
jgi:hypothetical protein